MSEIKVGSEWVDESFGNNQKFVVLYVGSIRAFISMDGVKEYSVPLSAFGNEYKPAPVRRTVWLNVYEDEVFAHKTKEVADKLARPGYLFQQKVELIDQREGEKARGE